MAESTMVAILIRRLRNDDIEMKRRDDGPSDHSGSGEAPPDDVHILEQPQAMETEDFREPQAASPAADDAAAAAAAQTTSDASMSDITYNKTASFEQRDEQRSAFSSVQPEAPSADEVVGGVEEAKQDQQEEPHQEQHQVEVIATPSPQKDSADDRRLGRSEEPLPFESPLRYYQQQSEQQQGQQEQEHTTEGTDHDQQHSSEGAETPHSSYHYPPNYPPHYQGYPPYGYPGYYHHPPPPPPPAEPDTSTSGDMGSSPQQRDQQYHPQYQGYHSQQYSPHHQQQEYSPYSYHYPPGQYPPYSGSYSQPHPHHYYPGQGTTPSPASDTLKETPSAITESTKGTTPSSAMARRTSSKGGGGESLELSPTPSVEEDDRKPAATDSKGRKIKGILKKESPRENQGGISDFEPIPLNEIAAIPVLSDAAAAGTGMDPRMDPRMDPHVAMRPPSPPAYASSSTTRHGFSRQFPHAANTPPLDHNPQFAAPRAPSQRAARSSARSSARHAHVAPPAPRATPPARRQQQQRTIAPSSSGSTASSAGGEGSSWERRFGELVEFKRVHGHCEVPQNYAENTSLGTWVNKQRMEQKNRIEGKNSSLNDSRLERLQSIGFRWAKRKGQASWDEKFNELLAYKAKFGNCHVPTKYKDNTALGRWVSTQRAEYKKYNEGAAKTSMNADKIRRLEEIGFAWFMAL